jgi:hypothetical protein
MHLPLLYQGTVIVSAEHDGESYIAAFNQHRAAGLADAPLPMIRCFSDRGKGRWQGSVADSGADQVTSFNPADGAALVYAGRHVATCGTVAGGVTSWLPAAAFPGDLAFAWQWPGVVADTGEVIMRPRC